MSANIAVKEVISAARADIWRSVRLDPGATSRRALEGDVETAYMLLGDAAMAIDAGDDSDARAVIAKALDLLRSTEAALIVEDSTALEAAIDGLARLVSYLAPEIDQHALRHLKPTIARALT